MFCSVFRCMELLSFFAMMYFFLLFGDMCEALLTGMFNNAVKLINRIEKTKSGNKKSEFPRFCLCGLFSNRALCLPVYSLSRNILRSTIMQ